MDEVGLHEMDFFADVIDAWEMFQKRKPPLLAKSHDHLKEFTAWIKSLLKNSSLSIKQLIPLLKNLLNNSLPWLNEDSQRLSDLQILIKVENNPLFFGLIEIDTVDSDINVVFNAHLFCLQVLHV